ncbi:SixA phosphatase family protein [Candidatus Foliamicus sp.]
MWLLRHAKAGPYSPHDFARPLAARGRRNAPAMGRKLEAIGCAPKRVLCSAGRRAVETLCGVLPFLPSDLRIDVLQSLYTFSPASLLRHLRELPRETGDLMVVGHNPALQETALLLAGSGDADALAALQGKFPTCAVAELEFGGAPTDHGWAESSAHLRRVLMPRPPRTSVA